MRTFLIITLTAALLAAAFATRPGKRELLLHFLDKPANGYEPWSSKAVQQAQREVKSVVVKDRLLWVDIEKDGKTIYTGLFAHWVPRGEKATQVLPSANDLAKVIAHAQPK